jgi:hypothetical protein
MNSWRLPRDFSDAIYQPSADEDYLMARIDSLYSLLEKDTTPFIVPEPNGFTLERTIYGGGPPHSIFRILASHGRGFKEGLLRASPTEVL